MQCVAVEPSAYKSLPKGRLLEGEPAGEEGRGERRRRVDSEFVVCVTEEETWHAELDRAVYDRYCRGGQTCMYFDERTQRWEGDDLDLSEFGCEEPPAPPVQSSPGLSSALRAEWSDVERAHDRQVADFLRGDKGDVSRYLCGAVSLADLPDLDDWLRTRRDS
mmetsp:Transcript_19762/g.62211  ORF Transcript_19762/g.62211 Transcript_19762/m.62211 type:complete len:163 (+) Transcript_19762:87-575(+)